MTRQTVTIRADGREIVLHTNARTVLSALRDARIDLHPADRVSPGRYAPVEAGLVVVVQRALPVRILVDGKEETVYTHAETVGDALAEAGIGLAPADAVVARGTPVGLASSLLDAGQDPLLASARPLLPRAQPTTREGQREGEPAPNRPVQLVVRRAVPITVHDAGLTTTIVSAADTVGDALRGAGIDVYLADRVRPELAAPVQDGMHVFIERSKAITIVCDDPEVAPTGSFVTRSRRETVREVLADEGIALSGREEVVPPLDTPVRHGMEVSIRRFHPVTIAVDGRTIAARTKRGTIRELLADEQIALGPLDRITPHLDAEPKDGTVVTIVRVREVEEEEEEAIPYETLTRADPDLELDTTDYRPGKPGVLKRKLKVIYENGQPISKTVLEEWVDDPPEPEVYYYGTKVVLREIETPQGTFTYWRKLKVLATYYHNSTTGKSASDPEYGITRTGTRTRVGVVATDPNVIPLWTKMYIPGYGVGVAEDTGGGVKGKHIDVYMPEGESWWGVRYPEIYLLTPVPDWYPARLP